MAFRLNHGRLSEGPEDVAYRFTRDQRNLILTYPETFQGVSLTYDEQIKLLAVLVTEHTDLAEAIVKEVRRDGS
jgi:hypothetical protein